MIDKSLLMRQMRKYAKTFSSATSPPKEVDEASIKRALGLIDLVAKETYYGSLRKLSIKVPNLLKALRPEDNLNFLHLQKDLKNKLGISKNFEVKNKREKEKNKFDRAEKKLLKLLSTKDC